MGLHVTVLKAETCGMTQNKCSQSKELARYQRGKIMGIAAELIQGGSESFTFRDPETH
jgi:hypothetical protein